MRNPRARKLEFLGYRAKKPWPVPVDWDPGRTTGVTEVCSPSDCLATPPPGWRDRWDFNRATCYGTAAAAAATIPSESRAQYTIYAYWLMPVTTRDGQLVEVALDAIFDAELPQLPAEEGPGDCEELGFDVLSLTHSLVGFGHAPLSCNGIAREVSVNRYCLVGDLDQALTLVARFNAEQPEPGTYYPVLVARQPRP